MSDTPDRTDRTPAAPTPEPGPVERESVVETRVIGTRAEFDAYAALRDAGAPAEDDDPDDAFGPVPGEELEFGSEDDDEASGQTRPDPSSPSSSSTDRSSTDPSSTDPSSTDRTSAHPSSPDPSSPGRSPSGTPAASPDAPNRAGADPSGPDRAVPDPVGGADKDPDAVGEAEAAPGAAVDAEPTGEGSYERFPVDGVEEAEVETATAAARRAVEAGECIVLPTDTVYGIGADAFSPAAVQRLLVAKGRGRDMPPPVLIGDAALIRALAVDVPTAATDLVARYWPGPLTVIVKIQPSLRMDLGDSQGTIALRVPDHAVAREVLRHTGPMAVSSANRSGQTAAVTCDEAVDQLGGRVAVYLDGGTVGGPDGAPSTIVDFTRSPGGEVLRHGSLSLETLRETAPSLRDGTPPPPRPEREPQAETEPDPAARNRQEPEAASGKGPEPAPEGGLQPDPSSGPQAHPDGGPQPHPDSGPQPHPDSGPQPHPDSGPQPHPDSGPQPGGPPSAGSPTTGA